LIVDDDSAIQHLFEQFLQGEGFSTSIAANGLEAIILIKENPPDLIITDIIMDGMDGLALIREVKKIIPETPIIAISGGQRMMSVDFEQPAEKTGSNQFLEKPVRLAELLQSIYRLLGENPPEK
jgi:CheY-like chemotaxis protein